MTLPQDELRELMKEVGKVLRPLGFRGSVNYWRCVTDHGLAVVRRSGGKDREGLGFSFTLASTPRIWWEFGNWKREREGQEPLPLDHKNVAGVRLLEHAPGEQEPPPMVWKLGQHDGEPCDSDVDHARQHLPAAAEWMGQRARRMTDPGQYLRELLALPDKNIGAREAIAVLLAEYGPSQALDEAVDQMKAAFTARGAHDHAEKIIEFVYSRHQ